jgi:alkyl sulfatase BDS1-like metallo-beta-lactamase superfamily hydrolase
MDHASGIPPFLTEAKEKGLPRPRLIGHKNVVSRFDRYRRMSGYTARIRSRWPKNFDYPDTIYTEMLTVKVGDTMLDLYHAKGETDDHTWVWWPEAKTVFTGDLFTWVSPNAGSPRQVQRYPEEWASALHTMSALSPEVLIPGHGFPIFGVERIRQALNDTAQWLDSLVKQTIDLMNEGKILDQILQAVKPPAHLIGRPYLLSIYVDPEHIVRNIWQLYGGWYDGILSNLNPAPHALLAREVVSLAGGVEVVTNRARDLAKAGDLQLASHLIDWAFAAQPENKEAKSIRSEIYNERMERSPFLISKGIYGEAARESKES